METPSRAEYQRLSHCSLFPGERDWSQLPEELLLGAFKLLRLQDLGRCAQVCRGWRRTTQDPCLWREAEFVLGSSLR